MERDRREGAVLSDIRTVAVTGSTNADVLELAREGAGEGLWLRADRQSTGRGRQGRVWESPPGNLYASTLVRLRQDDPPAPTLALVAGIAIEHASHSHADSANPPEFWLKWPNDLLIENAKVAGILLERSGDVVVLGFGVNVASAPVIGGRATTDLAAHGVQVSPAELLYSLRDTLAIWLATWRDQGLANIRQSWLERSFPVGTQLSVNLPDGERASGAFDGLTDDGALALRLASGERRVIHAGDVFQV